MAATTSTTNPGNLGSGLQEGATTQTQTQTTGNSTSNPGNLGSGLQAPTHNDQSDHSAIEAGEEEEFADSAYGESTGSFTTSISTSIYQGVMQNGRRYQTLKEGDYWGPSDEKQFESMETVHLVQVVLDSVEERKWFRSPISKDAQRIIDVGTGTGCWAIDVADSMPNITVYGVDLFPPPQQWVPPNCIFEVDDVTKPWTYTHKFDLVHLRIMVAAFTPEDWKRVYKNAYDNLVPGGWVEHQEIDINLYCDDGTMPEDSPLQRWGPDLAAACAKSGRRGDTTDTMRADIEEAGFINVHEKKVKVPCGEWAKHPVMKEAGKLHQAQFKAGMEGYALYLLTNYGEPEPWTVEQVQVYLSQVRKAIDDKRIHKYAIYKRVWAQKPLDAAN